MSNTEQKIQDAAHAVKNELKDAAHDAKNKVKDAANNLENKVKDATHDVKHDVKAAAHESENKARKILSTLKDVLTGTNTIEHFLELAGKSPPPGILLDAIDLHNDLSEEHTVVHIVAHDLQGLLYLMTRSLSQCGLNIHSAKIATWNARAENNFYVTSMKGGQIPDIELQIWTERLAGVLQGNGIET